MQESVGPPDGAGTGPAGVTSALGRVVRETGASIGMVYLLAPGEDVLRLGAVTGVSQQIAAPWARVPLSDQVPVATCVRERRMVWLGSQEEVAHRYPRVALVLPYDYATAAHPITTDTTDWGAVALVWPGTHPPTLSARERASIRACCRWLGLVLEHASDGGRPLITGSRPHVLSPSRGTVPGPAEALATAEFIERLPGGCCTLDPEGRITFINASAAALVGAAAAALIGTVPWESLPWLDDPSYEDHYRSALISRRPTAFNALRPPDHVLSFRLYPDASGISVRIIAVAPDESEQESPTVPPPVPDNVMPSRAATLYHLTHLAATLTEAVGVHDVVAQAADQLVPAFGAQALALMVAEEGRLRVIGHRGYDTRAMSSLDGTPLTSQNPEARVLSTGFPAFFNSFDELRQACPTTRVHDGMAAWALLPLIASGRGIGTLVLAYDQPRGFAPADRSILVSLAGLIAQAVDRARLYDAEHQLAQSLQAALLPHTLPRIGGLDVAARYVPATRHMAVGGDFYDLIRLDDTNVGAAIGDVQGHNVNAAALMGQVRTAVRANSDEPPSEVLARTNRLLTDINPGLFTSCLYAGLDLAHHRALLSTAGHPPPLLRHPDGRTEILDLPPGLLLGIEPDAEYQETEITLPPGCVLALYTDGLIETPGVDLDDSTKELAQQLARAEFRTMDDLADTLIHYAVRSAPRNDDIAMLLIHPHAENGRRPGERP